MDKIHHSDTNEMVCPYCGHICNDSREFDENDGTRTCGECDMEFNYIRNIEITYTTEVL